MQCTTCKNLFTKMSQSTRVEIIYAVRNVHDSAEKTEGHTCLRNSQHDELHSLVKNSQLTIL